VPPVGRLTGNVTDAPPSYSPAAMTPFTTGLPTDRHPTTRAGVISR
jgi:hypothetical protein